MSEATMIEWDRSIAPHLSSIEYNAIMANNYVARISTAVAYLPERPKWETNARDRMVKSIETVDAMRAALQAALERYDALPVMDEPKFLQAAE